MNVTVEMFYFVCYVFIGYLFLRIVRGFTGDNKPVFIQLLITLVWPLIIGIVLIIILITLIIDFLKFIYHYKF